MSASPYTITAEQARQMDDETLAANHIRLYRIVELQNRKDETTGHLLSDEEYIAAHKSYLVLLDEITTRIWQGKYNYGACAVCGKTTVVKWCPFCRKWLCLNCWTDYPARFRAMLREIKQKVENNLLKLKSGVGVSV